MLVLQGPLDWRVGSRANTGRDTGERERAWLLPHLHRVMARYSSDYGTTQQSTHSNAFSSAFHHNSHRHVDSSLIDDCLAGVKAAARSSWRFWKASGRHLVFAFLVNMLRRVRHNLAMRRLLSFPHALVAVWLLLLLWGERWVFHSRVESCHWSSWENWVCWLQLTFCHALCKKKTGTEANAGTFHSLQEQPPTASSSSPTRSSSIRTPTPADRGRSTP